MNEMLVILFLLWLIITWSLFTYLPQFSSQYLISSFQISVSSILSFFIAFHFWYETIFIWKFISFLLFIFGIFFLVMFLTKIFFYRNSQYQSARKFFRSHISIDSYPTEFELNQHSLPNQSPSFRKVTQHDVFTEDKVKIKITLISTGFKKVIIIAHGAFRHRHTSPYVFLAQWLAYKYDIILLDFRGHGESSGFYNFSEATILDLKAVIDFAEDIGYNKVGVIGRSMGAWTALLEQATYQNIHSLIAAAAPLGQITEISLAKNYRSLIQTPMIGGFLAIIAQIVLSYFKNTRVSDIRDSAICPIQVVSKLLNIPIFLIYNEYDPVIETTQAEAYKLYNALSCEKELLVLAGKGHIFELAQFFQLSKRIEYWFDSTL